MNGSYFMDHCFPFGANNAHNRLGITIDAVVDILKAMCIGPVPKWADDPFLIRFPIGESSLLEDGFSTYRYSYDLSYFKEAVAPLCIPWHPSKWNKFLSTPVYLGLVWDFIKHTVSLAETKNEKYLAKVTDFLLNHITSHIMKKQAMSIFGTLSHVTMVHQNGRLVIDTGTGKPAGFTRV